MRNSIKRVVAIMLTFLMIFNIFGIIPAFAETSATYTNFALGKTVEFGYMEEISTDVNWSVEAINNGLGALTDGVNNSTNWAVNNVSPETTPDNPYIGLKNTVVTGPYSFTVDLGEVLPVSKASLHSITIASWSLWTTKNVTYSVSQDGDNWSTVGSVAAEDVIKTSASNGSTAITFYNFELIFDTVEARYVRADFETNPNSNGVHGFGEFEIYGKKISVGADVAFEYGEEVQSNASWDATAINNGIGALTDGAKNSTSWAVNNADPTKYDNQPYVGVHSSYVTGPYSFTLDLGEVTPVGKASLHTITIDSWSLDTVKSITYSTSEDGETWQTVGTVTADEAIKTNGTMSSGTAIVFYNFDLTFDSVNARYVRADFKTNPDSNGMHGFSEFEVYEGEPSSIPEGNIVEAVIRLPETWNFSLIEGSMTFNDNLYYIEDSFTSPDVPDMIVSVDNGVISFGAENIDGGVYNLMNTGGILCSAKFVALDPNGPATVTSEITRALLNTGSSYETMSTTSEVVILTNLDQCGENATWTFDKTTGTLTVSGTGDMYNVSAAFQRPWMAIASAIKHIVIEEGITSVGNGAFADCINLESVSLPSTLTKIGESAFTGSEFNSSKLTSITIPKNVTTIGRSAFQFSGLTSVEIPDSVTSIGYYAFAYCKNLTSAKLSANVPVVPVGMFSGCKSLANVTIPAGVTTIGSEAFYSCFGMTSVEIPDSVTTIDSAAFMNCINLATVQLPANVTTIGNSAFMGCNALTDVELPSTLTTIGEGAFSNCSALTSITIPSSVTSIGAMAFDGVAEGFTAYVYTGTAGYTYAVENSINYVVIGGVLGDDVMYEFDAETGVLTISGTGATYDYAREATTPLSSIRLDVKEVVVEDGVTRIGNGLFYYFTATEKLTMADSVTSVGDYTFYRCTSLVEINWSKNLTSIGTCAFQRNSSLKELTLPESLTTLETGAFGQSGVQSVVLPENATNLGTGIFSECSSLITATLPETLTSIPANMFGGCAKLNSVTIPETVTSIGNYSFSNCSQLSYILLPDALETIGEGAFLNCSGLKEITIPEAVTTIGESAFEGVSETFVLYATINTVAHTYAEENSITYNLLGLCGEDVRFIFDPATGHLEIYGKGDMFDATRENEIPLYSILSSIKSVTINDGVTSIGDMAFYYCQNLASVEIPDSVTSIGSKAFFRCLGLKAVDVPDTVTEIGTSAFARSGITSIEIPSGVTEIPNSAFEMSALTSVIIPEGVTSIGDSAFSMCSSLTSADIPDSVVSIGNNAFGYCTVLTEASLPAGLVSIGNSAFASTAIYEINLPRGLESIGENAFNSCHNVQTVTIPASVTYVGVGAFTSISNSFVAYGYCGSAAQKALTAEYVQFLGFGDANCDGELTISDATEIQRHIAKISEIGTPAILDVNDDGNLSIRDVTYIQMYIAKMITEFPITE